MRDHQSLRHPADVRACGIRRFAFQARPVATAVFFAARFSFAPVLRMTLFADLLVFFDEDLDFLRLAFFMEFLPFH
jgi:hypothetical protein